MDFEQFKEELASSVKEIMYSKYGMEVEVEARTMEKMNSSYEALTVKRDYSNTINKIIARQEKLFG